LIIKYSCFFRLFVAYNDILSLIWSISTIRNNYKLLHEFNLPTVFLLTKRSQLQRIAKTSNTPGRTQLINYFQIDEQRFIVDLPGYGYAKVPLSVKAHWHKLLERYFNERKSLAGLVLLMDCRHPLRDLDWQMLDWCRFHDLPSHVILTKSDKLRGKALDKTLEDAQQALTDHGYHDTTLQLMSSSKKLGIDVLTARLDEWFQV